MKDIIFLGLAGMPGSGKGEVAEVAKKRGIPVFSIGNIVREWFARKCPEKPASEMNEYSNKEKKEKGNIIWAKRLAEKLKNQNFKSKLIIIDGIRSPEEVDFFKTMFDFRVVAIIASEETRFKRNSVRGRADDSADFAAFKKRDETEISWGSEEVIQNSEYKIENEGTLKELDEKINFLLNKLKNKK